jgi:hypothetical protein
MPKLQILTEAAYCRLSEPTNLKAVLSGYRTDSECSLVANSDRLDLPIYELNGSASLSMPKEGLASKSDAENAQLVYEYLGPLKPIYAAEGRLWASLTHGDFWEYSRWRFPLPENDESAVKHVRSHWFVESSGLAALRRNAVARLWWAAELTVAPWERDSALTIFQKADRYHFTKGLLASQQVYQDVMERDFGSNLRLRISFLDALLEHANGSPSLDKLVKESAVQMTLLLRFRHLLTLPVPEMSEACKEVVGYAKSNLDRA